MRALKNSPKKMANGGGRETITNKEGLWRPVGGGQKRNLTKKGKRRDLRNNKKHLQGNLTTHLGKLPV